MKKQVDSSTCRILMQVVVAVVSRPLWLLIPEATALIARRFSPNSAGASLPASPEQIIKQESLYGVGAHSRTTGARGRLGKCFGGFDSRSKHK